MNRTKRLQVKIGWAVAILCFGVTVVPFAFIGETWGMIWFYLTVPISMIFEAIFGIGSKSYFIIGLVSAINAGIWATIAYLFTSKVFR